MYIPKTYNNCNIFNEEERYSMDTNTKNCQNKIYITLFDFPYSFIVYIISDVKFNMLSMFLLLSSNLLSIDGCMVTSRISQFCLWMIISCIYPFNIWSIFHGYTFIQFILTSIGSFPCKICLFC